MSSDTFTTSDVIRVRYFDTDQPYDSWDLGRELITLNELVRIAAILETLAFFQPHEWGFAWAGDNAVTLYGQHANQAARHRVVSLNYNSPIETVLAFATVAGALGTITLATGNRVVDLFNKAQEARVGKARADYKVSAYKVLTKSLDTSSLPQDVEMVVREKSKLNFGEASDALSNIESIELVDEGPAGTPPLLT